MIAVLALKPDVVLFGELLPADALVRAEGLAARADLLLCIGSSLEVYPVAELPATTLACGGGIAVMTARADAVRLLAPRPLSAATSSPS